MEGIRFLEQNYVDKKNSTIGSWLGAFFSLVVIAYVLWTLDFRQVMETFSHMRWVLFFLAFGIYLLNYLLRTWRFRLLLSLDDISFDKLFGLTSLYGMYLYLLPAKSGEASYPVMLKNRLKVALTHSTATLIVARFFDFATVALFIPFVLVPFWMQIHPIIRWVAVFFVASVVLGSVFGLGFVRHSDKWHTWSQSSSMGILGRIKTVLGRLLASLAEIDRQGQYWLLALLTIAIWACVQANFFLIIRALGYSLSLLEIIVVTIIMVPMTLLPLQGFANLGTHEIGWTAAFALFGYTQATALSIAVSSHIVLLIFVLTLGLVGRLFLKGIRI